MSSTPSLDALDDLRQQVQQYRDEQTVLTEISIRLARGGALDALLPDCAAAAWRGLNAEGVRLLLNDGTAHTAGSGAAGMATYDRVIGAAINGDMLEVTDKNAPTPELSHVVQSYPTVLAFPLMAHGERYGTLWAAYGKTHPITPAERSFGLILSAHIAVAIANARAFEAARRGRGQVAAILASSVDPMMVCTLDGMITLLNPAAEQAFGISASEVMGKHIDSVIKDAEPLVNLLKGSGAESIEWSSSTERFFAPRVSEVRDDGGMTGRVLVLRDITRYVRLRENQADFASTISHDMRLPLTSMRGWLDMLPMAGALNERQSGMIEKIYSGILHISDLVEKIHDASRFDPEGNYVLSREPMDIAQMVTDTANTHRQPAEQKKLTFTLDVAPDLPVLMLDEGMKRAVSNLIDNAIKYTPEGGTVTISAKLADGKVAISVKDSGLGISAEHQTKLFERFSRVRCKEFERIKGSGLGLYNVKRIAQRHYGDATLKSAEGKGSEFTIIIPLEGENLIGAR